MNGKLLDTNIIIRYIKDEDNLDDIFEEENANVYSNFCSELVEIKSDSIVAPFYAKIKAQLKKDGHPIPENDIWISACAMAYNLTVVTGDKHFSFIKGVSIEYR